MTSAADLLQSAMALHRAGKMAEAEKAYAAIPVSAPEHVDAVHLRGVLALQRGSPVEAIQLIQQAIQVRNDVPAMHSNIAEAYRATGKLHDAVAHARKALTLDPNYHSCRSNLALSLASKGDLAEAEKELRKVVEAEPRNALAWSNLANVLHLAKRNDDALGAARKAVQLEPTNPEFLSNLGQLLVEDRDFEEARQRLENAVRLAPNLAAARNNLGNLYREMELLDEAGAQYDEALKIQPNLAITHNNHGQLSQQRGDYDAALAWYRKSLELNPREVKTLCNYASALADLDQHADASRLYRAALELEPRNAAALSGVAASLRRDSRIEEAKTLFEQAVDADPKATAPRLGLAGVLAELGDFAASEREAREALSLDPESSSAYETLSSTLRKKLPEDDFRRMQALLGRKGMSRPRARISLLYGLGTYCDQTGRYEEGARYLDEANSLEAESRQQRGLAFSPEEHARWVDGLIKAFDAKHFEKVQGWGLDSDVPVFVLGLPRSGTTLAEQVLASHTRVFGADELRLARESLHSIPSALESPEPVLDSVSKLTPTALRSIALAHLDQLRAYAPEADRIVDKMPENYLQIGMIVTMFPNARIIHMQRDLRDVATSCWNVHFGQIRWANKREHILSNFADYMRIMAHWREVLPGRILDMPYADMVDDLETHARRMLDFCGLEWEPACLDFHKTERTVRTASLAQVRQPLYKKAVARWKNYEPWWGEWYEQLDALQRQARP